MADDNHTILGGVYILETESKEEAIHFADEDPYSKAGIRRQTLVKKWHIRWNKGNFLG